MRFPTDFGLQNRWVFYGQDENGKEMSLAGSDQGENLKVQHIWEELGVKFEPNMA